MKRLRYSIIIPHHNMPLLLKRLIDSIPQRDDTEVIVVDDNSDPNIVDFGMFPGHDRSDVRLCFDKKGGYGGYARNIGLDMAQGEWILFADSDDFFMYSLNDVLDECYSLEDNVDLVFFSACSLDCMNYTNTDRAKHVQNKIDGYSKNSQKYGLLLRYKFGEPWCKLARKSMLDKHHIRFEERSIHNDTAYSYLVGYYAKGIKVCPQAIYCITDRGNSVSKVLTELKKLERIDNFATSALFFKSHNIPVDENRHFLQLLECYRTNKDTFYKGMDILKKHGYTAWLIKIQLMKAVFYYIALRTKRMININK